MQHTPEIIVTEHDLTRLRTLIASAPSAQEDAADRLDQELSRARIVAVPELPSDVVTMNSRVRFEDLETHDEREITLVYPQDADIEAGKVSVLAPIGGALLGLRVGQVIEWPVPRNRNKSIRVLEVLYQPEAAGDLDR
jgi:regulator of nucleoside diphosphate kinase